VNVLITSASRKVNLVRSFQAAVRQTGGGRVIAVDATAYAPALYAADRCYLVPLSSEPGFLGEVARICKVESVSLLIPTRDEELILFSGARERFLSDGVRIMVPSSETVTICSDKRQFLDFCVEHRFSVPHTFDSENWNSEEFPLFIKPRFGKGGHGARIVRSEQELRLAVDDPEQWIAQECVTWPELTIDLLADFEGRVLSVVPRLRKLVIGGESYVSETIDANDLIVEAKRLSEELGLVGHNTIQCFRNGSTVKFIEVNPRFGGAAALGRAAGNDSPAALLRMVRGEKLPQQLGAFRKRLVMLRYTDDLFLDAEELLPPASSGMAVQSSSFVRDREAALKAVLFDLDNTLYPEEQFVLSGFRAVAQTLAARLNLAAQILSEKMLRILQDHGRGKVFDLLLDDLQINKEKWLPTLLQVYRSHRPVIFLFPGAFATLSALKAREFKIGLVTDGLASVQRRKIAALGLDSLMDVIVCTDELGDGYSKPSAAPFEVALHLLDVSPREAAYVADDISKDFAGPNHLGMKSVQIHTTGLVGVPKNSLPSDPVYHPKFTAATLEEALEVLELAK
jgi:carbamoyl-phosphate synthase large subunit